MPADIRAQLQAIAAGKPADVDRSTTLDEAMVQKLQPQFRPWAVFVGESGSQIDRAGGERMTAPSGLLLAPLP